MPMLSWPELHGAVTHFPVGLLLAGAAFDVGALVFRKDEWRIVSFWMLVAAVVMAVPSAIAGLMTANEIFGGPGRPPEIFYLHRNAALTAAVLAAAALAWRIRTQDRLTGAPRYGAVLLGLAAAATVGYAGFLGGRMVFADESQSREPTSLAPHSGKQTDDRQEAAEAGTEQRDNPAPELVSRGEALFLRKDMACLNCHTYQGRGGNVGPNLSDVGQEHPSIAWHIEHLKDPRKVHPGSTMPSYDTLSPEELEALSAFLATRRQDP